MNVAPPPARRGWRAGAGYGAIYAWLFAALGAQMAFLPLWLEDHGLSLEEIGTLTAFGVGVRIAAGVAAPALAERLNADRRMLIGLFALGALAMGLHLGVETRAGLYALTAAAAAAFAGALPLIDSAAYANAKRCGFSFAKARSAGSAAFLAATFLVGAAAQAAGSDAVIWWMVVAYAGAMVSALLAPIGAGATRSDAPPAQSGVRVLGGLLRDPRFLLVLAAAGAINASHATYYVYGSVHWRALGFSETLIGALWAWGVLAEILLFFRGLWILERLGPERALLLAGAASAVRWACMAPDPGLAALVFLQALHALSFALTFLAALEVMARSAPERSRATVKGFGGAVAANLAMALGAMLAAEAFQVSAAAAWLTSAALATAGAAFAAAAHLRAGRGGRAPADQAAPP